MRFDLNFNNPSSGILSNDYTRYGQNTYGEVNYGISAFYQSPYLDPKTVQYTISGRVYFCYRSMSTGTGIWSTWTESTTSGSITVSGQWQYRLIFTGNWDSGDYAEVI